MEYPKVTFNAKEVYDQAYDLSKKIPFWRTPQENPINQFVPPSERPFEDQHLWETPAEIEEARRTFRLSNLQGKERTLQLAGTMSLKKRSKSPLSKLRETRGQVTLKTVPDLFEQKRVEAKKEYPKSGYQYAQPKEYIFRNTDPGVVLGFGQEDMKLITHPDQLLPNPHGLSVHD